MPYWGFAFPSNSGSGNSTDKGVAALLKGFELMGKSTPELSVDIISGSITLLLSNFFPLVGTGLTKRHQNKAVLMCPGSVFMCSVFD